MSLVLIFLLALAAMAEFFLLWLAPAFALLALASALLILVVTGFAIRDNGWFLLFLPALPVIEKPLMEGMPNVPYPQVFLFRIRLHNLYLLLLPTLFAMVVLVLAFSKHQAVLNHYGAIACGMVLSGYALLIAVVWLKERRLVKLLRVAIGCVTSGSAGLDEPRYSYQYFDWTTHERRGGVVRFHRWLMSRPDLLTPVFFDPRDADYSRPGFAFWFHRFAIVDSRHTPSFLIEQAKRLAESS